MTTEEREAIRREAMQEFEETLLVEMICEMQKRGFGLQSYIHSSEFRLALETTRKKFGLCKSS